MTRTLEEVKDFVAGTYVNVLHVPTAEYPYYFLGEDILGWGEYIDFNNFNPFHLLGFEEVHYYVEYASDVDDTTDLEMETDRIIHLAFDGIGFNEILEKMNSFSDSVVITIERMESP